MTLGEPGGQPAFWNAVTFQTTTGSHLSFLPGLREKAPFGGQEPALQVCEKCGLLFNC